MLLCLVMLDKIALASGLITDTDLFTCNGTTCTLKYGLMLTGTVGSGITVGTSTITGGTPGYLLYDNSGILAELNPAGLTLAWGQITGTPTTIAGYGLTDALNVTMSNVTGVLGILNGGTGQTTANAALNALLPSQTGNAGTYLTTNGTNSSWLSVPATAWSTPGTIGSTTPNTGAFTTVSGTTGTFTSTLTAYRYVSGGTSLSSGNFSLPAGGGGTWGVGSSIGSVSGKDSGFTATVTTSGTPGINPILTLTFADGAWPSTPFATCGSWVTGTSLNADIATSTVSTLALQFIGTPTTGTAYTITCSWIHG